LTNEISDLESFAKKKKREISGEDFEPIISAEYKTVDEKGREKKEKIEIDFDEKLRYSVDFYVKHDMPMVLDFEEKVMSIWENNREEIEKEMANTDLTKFCLSRRIEYCRCP